MIISNTLHNIKVPKSIEHFITILKENPITFFAFLMLFFFLITAILGPYLVPYNPLETNAKISVFTMIYLFFFQICWLFRFSGKVI